MVMPAPLMKVDFGMKSRFWFEIERELCDWERTAKQEMVLKTVVHGIQLQLRSSSFHYFSFRYFVTVLSRSGEFYFIFSDFSSEHYHKVQFNLSWPSLCMYNQREQILSGCYFCDRGQVHAATTG